ncbi:MAG: maleylpyruvate isomerase family mycothiol-dependent enzyme [Mycobacterium sp.]
MSQTNALEDPPTAPRTSTLDRPTLMRLAATEYARFATMLTSLDARDWTQPTECAGWDVRAMAGHVLGMAEMAASIREGRRQRKAAAQRGGVFIDALTALQVQERAVLTPEQVSERFQALGPRAARARRRTPALIRRRKMPMQQAVGGLPETWALGYLIDTILTRDPWMHRIDISRATGRPLSLSADHDGVLVGDVVTEWAARHHAPCRLDLTGATGGSWTFGEGGPRIELDAIEFCRTVSGRERGTELLATEVPF